MPTEKADHHWRCDCGGGHFLSITWFPEDPRDNTADVDGYLEIEGDFRQTLRHRIRTAWDVLRSGHADTRVGLVLDAAKAREIAAVLAEFAGSVRSAG
jgi:hypothetical protein